MIKTRKPSEEGFLVLHQLISSYALGYKYHVNHLFFRIRNALNETYSHIIQS